MCDRTDILTPDDDRPCRWVARIGDGPRGPSTPARTRLARSGERLAAAHLSEHHGLDVLALNHRIAVEDVRGELDVVAFEPRTRLLVVCEVKARSDRAGGSGRGRGPGGALVALGPRQQARIRRMTAVLLASGTLRASRVRFDLVAVDVSSTSGRAELAHVADAW